MEGIKNSSAEALPRINVDTFHSLGAIDLGEMSKDQTTDEKFSQYKDSSSNALKFKLLPIHSNKSHILCNISSELFLNICA